MASRGALIGFAPAVEMDARIRGNAMGDELAAACERWRARLVAYAARVLGDPAEAEDVVQDVLVRAQGPGARDDIESLPAWLHAACYRRAIDRVRARRREGRALSARAEQAAEPPSGLGALERAEEATRLRALVGALDEPYRRALHLRYLDGLEFAELAARMGTIERTARTWVGRGLEKLRQRLRGFPGGSGEGGDLMGGWTP